MNEPPTSHQPALPDTNEDDVSMADPAAENVEDEGQGQGEQEEEGEEEEEEEEEEEPQRIRLVSRGVAHSTLVPPPLSPLEHVK